MRESRIRWCQMTRPLKMSSKFEVDSMSAHHMKAIGIYHSIHEWGFCPIFLVARSNTHFSELGLLGLRCSILSGTKYSRTRPRANLPFRVSWETYYSFLLMNCFVMTCNFGPSRNEKGKTCAEDHWIIIYLVRESSNWDNCSWILPLDPPWMSSLLVW